MPSKTYGRMSFSFPRSRSIEIVASIKNAILAFCPLTVNAGNLFLEKTYYVNFYWLKPSPTKTSMVSSCFFWHFYKFSLMDFETLAPISFLFSGIFWMTFASAGSISSSSSSPLGMKLLRLPGFPCRATLPFAWI